MKRSSVAALLLCLVLNTYAQEKQISLKWAPTGLVFGNIALQGEYSFGDHSSLTAKIALPVGKKYIAIYDENDADLKMKSLSFMAGYRNYLSKKKLRGFYLEPFFKYVHHTTDGIGRGMLDGDNIEMSFTNEYNAAGVGLQLGAQWIVAKNWVIDFFFFGPEINAASNRFKAVDISNSDQWNTLQAAEAEQDIRDFLDDFPFVRNKVDVVVDKPNRTVRADFKGALPGIRAGISIGVAL